MSVSDDYTNEWMMSIAAARHDHEQNLSAERRADGRVVFRTTRHVLKGEELRVWFTPELAGTLGVPLHVGSYEGTSRSNRANINIHNSASKFFFFPKCILFCV